MFKFNTESNADYTEMVRANVDENALSEVEHPRVHPSPDDSFYIDILEKLVRGSSVQPAFSP
jgi:hypothetical protein